MFDIAWSEMLVIMVVALVVIGPKDLPRLVREVGKWTARARSMGRDFQRSFDDMVREADLQDIKKDLDSVRPSSIQRTIRNALDPDGAVQRSLTADPDPPPGPLVEPRRVDTDLAAPNLPVPGPAVAAVPDGVKAMASMAAKAGAATPRIEFGAERPPLRVRPEPLPTAEDLDAAAAALQAGEAAAETPAPRPLPAIAALTPEPATASADPVRQP